MIYGYIHFDDPEIHNSGWLSDTKVSPIRLGEKETGELDNNHIWLSNLNFDIMQAAGLLNNVKYRRNDFLGEKVTSLAERLGFYDLSRENAIEFVRVMPQIFERVMKYASFYAGVEECHRDSLKSSLRQILIPNIDPILDSPEKIKYFEESNQSFTATVSEVYDQTDDKIPLYIPPDYECNFIFNQLYPKVKARWQTKKIKKKDSLTELFELKRNNVCGLVKIKVSGFSPLFDKFYNFGYSTGKRGSRQWVTFEEAIFLACEAEYFEIIDIFYTEDVYQPLDLLAIKDSIPEKNRYSISGMIFLHNLWNSMSARNIMNYKQASVRVNTLASFVRFYDRYLCATYALKLLQTDMKVTGFGSGKVYINCEGITPMDLLESARIVGVIPPSLDIKEDEDPVQFGESKKLLDIHQWLWGHNKTELILEFDKICSENLSKKI